MDKLVDLEKLTKGEVHNLSGHDRGLAARNLFELDALDKSLGENEKIVIRVPDYVYGVSPSFVQGFLATSVHSLGDDRDLFFMRFDLDASELVVRQFERGLANILIDRSEPLV